MKKKLTIAAVFIVIALGAYGIASNFGNPTPSSVNMDENAVKQLVNDYSMRAQTAQNASITSKQLIVTNEDGTEVKYDLPKEEFFASIAPYIETTHPCATHNLIGCQGEMVNEQFEVYIEDKEGNLIMDKTVQSQPNGFIDLWLPRDKELNVTIKHNGKSVQSKLTTFENDNTCITTMQLS